MRRLKILLFFAALPFVFSSIVLLWGDEAVVIAEDFFGEPTVESGAANPSEVDAVALQPLKDDRALDLEVQYAAEIGALLQEIENETDPMERERMQKDIQKLKAEQEIALAELYLEIAAEKGDEERVAELGQILDQLYSPSAAEPDDQGVKQPLDLSSSGKMQKRDKNPDDL